MAQVIGGLAMSHAPQLLMPPEKWPELGRPAIGRRHCAPGCPATQYPIIARGFKGGRQCCVVGGGGDVIHARSCGDEEAVHGLDWRHALRARHLSYRAIADHAAWRGGQPGSGPAR
jgi:hypothetical protein